jgi:hypothetical protein
MKNSDKSNVKIGFYIIQKTHKSAKMRRFFDIRAYDQGTFVKTEQLVLIERKR